MKKISAIFVSALICLSACSGNGGDGGTIGEACGGLLGLQCGQGEFCKFGPDCGAADQTGVCEEIPEVCTEEFAPVCGCDARTYSNECSASGAGVSVQFVGECQK